MSKPPQSILSSYSSNSYQFSLKSNLHGGLLNVVVDFTPVKALIDRQQLHTFSILPSFNQDLKCFTSGFCTDYEGVNAKKQLATYKQKLKTATKEINASKILVPKPRQKRKRKCWICHIYFEDYLEHIELLDHRKKLQKNRYNKSIKGLVAQFGVNYTKERIQTRSMTRKTSRY